jgi:hypothetical protein
VQQNVISYSTVSYLQQFQDTSKPTVQSGFLSYQQICHFSDMTEAHMHYLGTATHSLSHILSSPCPHIHTKDVSAIFLPATVKETCSISLGESIPHEADALHLKQNSARS